jgi:hypothetical protein
VFKKKWASDCESESPADFFTFLCRLWYGKSEIREIVVVELIVVKPAVVSTFDIAHQHEWQK